VPERRIGFEALEASVKLRKSSVDCLSAASFGAARSEQLRLPAEEPLERRDASSCKRRLNFLGQWGFDSWNDTSCTTNGFGLTARMGVWEDPGD
jgi:molybdenum cofactor biosynthesis enzyme MoaA